MKTMKIIPRSKPGKSSLVLIGIMPLFQIVGIAVMNNLYKDIPSGKTIAEDLLIRPGLAIPMLIGILSGVAAFATGFWAIWKKKERSLLTYITTVIGFIFCLFLLGEIGSPY